MDDNGIRNIDLDSQPNGPLPPLGLAAVYGFFFGTLLCVLGWAGWYAYPFVWRP